MRVFGPERFSAERRESAAAFWQWHQAALDWTGSASDRDRVLAGEPPEDAHRIRAGIRPEGLPSRVWEAAETACRRHRLDPALLADRLDAVARLRVGSAPRTGGDLRELLRLLVGSHAVLLAALADMRGSWQREGAVRLASGFTLLGNLLNMREAASRRLVLIPIDDLETAGMGRAALAGNRAPDGYGRIAWKQSIRARDELAGGRAFILELELRDRLYGKRMWLGALELLHRLERVGFDTWQRPASLTPIAKSRVLIQSIFGRTAFRSA